MDIKKNGAADFCDFQNEQPREEIARFAWLPFLLQTSDALFPTGAYAHSLGLEEIARLGIVRDEDSLREFLRQQIIPALRELELPFLRFAFNAVTAGELETLCALDREISAWKLARETREASAWLGGRRLKALRAIRGDARLLADFEKCIERNIERNELAEAAPANAAVRGHHLVVCGLQAAVENVPLEAALSVYFYQSLSAMCAAALKLIRIGQEGCQRVLSVCLNNSLLNIRLSQEITRERAGWFNPLLEVASMRHERADERLFIS